MRSLAWRGPIATPGATAAAVIAAALATLAAGTAAAHGLGISQLRLRVDGPRVDGEWEIQLHDARVTQGLDPQVGGEAGWLDLRQHEPALRDYLGRRIALAADGRPCPVTLAASPMEWQSAQSQVLFHLASTCPTEPIQLGLRCDLLFDLDPRHRAYFSVQDARATHVGVLRDGLRAVTIDVRHFHAAAVIAEFVREGVRHIGTGLDHLLFLLALLLPAPLVRANGGWSPRRGLGSVAAEVVKVVTAFTLAHTLTLCLSFFGLITLPSRWVEVGVAASVLAAAWNNLRPFLPGRGWTMALVFGLVHGLGFAGALRNLGLPTRARGLALAAFNAGVEIGQLAIVAAVLPLLYAASRRRFYPRLVLGAGSFLIAWLAVLWILERAFALSLLPARL